MGQLLGLGVVWSLGIVVCFALAARLTTRLGLPWEEALMYFGLVPHPEERLVATDPGAARTAAPARPSVLTRIRRTPRRDGDARRRARPAATAAPSWDFEWSTARARPRSLH